jgi:hypothetical protein
MLYHGGGGGDSFQLNEGDAVTIRGIDGGMYRRMFVSTDVYIDGCSIRMACERGRTLVVGEDCVLEKTGIYGWYVGAIGCEMVRWIHSHERVSKWRFILAFDTGDGAYSRQTAPGPRYPNPPIDHSRARTSPAHAFDSRPGRHAFPSPASTSLFPTFRNANFWIFPLAVLGYSGTQKMYLGTTHPPPSVSQLHKPHSNTPTTIKNITPTEQLTQMPTQPLPHPLPHLLRCNLHHMGIPNHKGRDDLSIALIRQADDADFSDAGVAEDAVFDFEGVDVLPAADDEVFDAAGDLEVAVGGHASFVAGLGDTVREEELETQKERCRERRSGGRGKGKEETSRTCIQSLPCSSGTSTSMVFFGSPQ